MEVLVIGVTAATLLYVLAVAGLAYQLKRMPRPYSKARSKQYLRSIERLRVSLWAVFTLLGANALLYAKKKGSESSLWMCSIHLLSC